MKTCGSQKELDDLEAELLKPLPGWGATTLSEEAEAKIAADELAGFGKALSQTQGVPGRT